MSLTTSGYLTTLAFTEMGTLILFYQGILLIVINLSICSMSIVKGFVLVTGEIKEVRT